MSSLEEYTMPERRTIRTSVYLVTAYRFNIGLLIFTFISQVLPIIPGSRTYLTPLAIPFMLVGLGFAISICYIMVIRNLNTPHPLKTALHLWGYIGLSFLGLMLYFPELVVASTVRFVTLFSVMSNTYGLVRAFEPDHVLFPWLMSLCPTIPLHIILNTLLGPSLAFGPLTFLRLSVLSLYVFTSFDLILTNDRLLHPHAPTIASIYPFIRPFAFWV